MMFPMLLIVAATLLLAGANGANDNFKGVATLYGSRTLGRGAALTWATCTTLAGSLAAAWLATELTCLFSGKGLVPDRLVADPAFALSVACGAALTVGLAAWRGLPISTTHALVGALTGTGLVAAAGKFQWQGLVHGFVWPLFASPFIALVCAAILYRLLSGARRRLGISRDASCVCVTGGRAPAGGEAEAAVAATMPGVIVDDVARCERYGRYHGVILGLDLQRLVEAVHVLSSGAVSFARGLNDTPKVVGVALAAAAVDARWLTFAAAVVMAVGGVIGSQRVAATMSERITEIQHGKGLAANLVTSFLVIVASRWGVPVSTTHVSCGAIFGIGGDAEVSVDRKVIRNIVLSWVVTLPVAAVLAAVTFVLLRA